MILYWLHLLNPLQQWSRDVSEEEKLFHCVNEAHRAEKSVNDKKKKKKCLYPLENMDLKELFAILWNVLVHFLDKT